MAASDFSLCVSVTHKLKVLISRCDVSLQRKGRAVHHLPGEASPSGYRHSGVPAVKVARDAKIPYSGITGTIHMPGIRSRYIILGSHGQQTPIQTRGVDVTLHVYQLSSDFLLLPALTTNYILPVLCILLSTNRCLTLCRR